MGLIGPPIPAAKPGGHTRMVDVRSVVDGVMYILSSGWQWSALPQDLPPRSTVTASGGADSDGGGHLFQSHRGQAGIVSKVGFGHVIGVRSGSSVRALLASMPLESSCR